MSVANKTKTQSTEQEKKEEAHISKLFLIKTNWCENPFARPSSPSLVRIHTYVYHIRTALFNVMCGVFIFFLRRSTWWSFCIWAAVFFSLLVVRLVKSSVNKCFVCVHCVSSINNRLLHEVEIQWNLFDFVCPECGVFSFYATWLLIATFLISSGLVVSRKSIRFATITLRACIW